MSTPQESANALALFIQCEIKPTVNPETIPAILQAIQSNTTTLQQIMAYLTQRKDQSIWN